MDRKVEKSEDHHSEFFLVAQSQDESKAISISRYVRRPLGIAQENSGTENKRKKLHRLLPCISSPAKPHSLNAQNAMSVTAEEGWDAW